VIDDLIDRTMARDRISKCVRILSYNVRYFGHATRGIASTRKAMQRIADAIASLEPLADIVCLQEVETASIRSNVAHRRENKEETQLSRFMTMLRETLAARKLPDEYEAYYFPAHAYRLSKETHVYTTGLAVLAHRDFTVDHHNAKEPADITSRKLHPIKGLKQTRICAHIRFRYRGGQTVDVFNTHLSLPTTFSRAFWTGERRMGYGPNQLVEAKNVISFVEKNRSSDRFLLTGDFNALPGSPVYEHFVNEAGYSDAFGTLYKMSAEELRLWPTAGFMRLRMHLDHVFTGRGLKWLDFEGTHPFGDRESKFFGLSDHMPMIGRCRVSAKGESVRPPRFV
jgi:endonuclease/exonuclease/phosphatase family metal-dependent hydrolase